MGFAKLERAALCAALDAVDWLALDEAVPPSVHRATTAVELPSDVTDDREDDAPGKV